MENWKLQVKKGLRDWSTLALIFQVLIHIWTFLLIKSCSVGKSCIIDLKAVKAMHYIPKIHKFQILFALIPKKNCYIICQIWKFENSECFKHVRTWDTLYWCTANDSVKYSLVFIWTFWFISNSSSCFQKASEYRLSRSFRSQWQSYFPICFRSAFDDADSAECA